MKLSFRPALALLLGTALAASLSSCDYRWSPGLNPQFRHGFGKAPGWKSYDVFRDSINYKQTVTQAGGEGSAAAIANGTVQDQLNSAPAGDNTTSPQNASGTLASPDQESGQGGGVDRAAGQNEEPQPKPQPR